MGITSVDKNFVVQTDIDREGLVFTDIEDRDEIKLYGVKHIDGCYRRLPEEVARATSEGVEYLHRQTAGGRIRFVTDSPYIAIHATLNSVDKMPHFPMTGSAGYDLYRNGIYIGTYVPSVGTEIAFESVLNIEEKGVEAEYVINFPLYCGINKLYLGLKEGSSLKAPSAYALPLPVVYYGSSITQGGCASRPGNAYMAILSRLLHIDHINLGFSGSACGEDAMIDYIASLEMSAFVCDYDHNAPSNEHLRDTHEKLYRAVRKAHPALPILFLTRPKYHLFPYEVERVQIVRDTYEKALSEGDKNVYFIPGPELLSEEARECALVDNTHPSDAGFVSMAYKILPVLKEMLKL